MGTALAENVTLGSRTASSTPYFTAEVSAAIRLARVMCITLMMFVHIWPGASNILAAEVPPALHLVYFVLIEELGRASVPLLSIVSGLLFFRSAVTSGWHKIVTNKTRTLLVPMAAWSALALLLYAAEAVATGNSAFFEVPTLTWLNRIFALTAPPSNLPLAFLRDIFVCCLIGLAACGLDRQLPWSGRALMGILVVTEYASGGTFLLRPSILVFFVLGYLIAVLNPRSLVLPWPLVLWVLAIDIGKNFLPDLIPPDWAPASDFIHRVAMAMLMWRIALMIVRRDGRLRRLIEAAEPMIFLVFCSHMISIMVMAVGFRTIGLSAEHPLYFAAFAAQIPAIFAVAYGLRIAGQRYAPGLLAVLTGK